MYNRQGYIGGFRRQRVGTGLQTDGNPIQPVPTNAEYQYGTHELAIKGSKAAGYGVTFGAFLALASNAMLQHKGSVTLTRPQDPSYQASSVNPASPALFSVVAAPRFFGSILGQQQDSLELNQSAIYTTTQRLQRPLFATIITTPQASQEIAPSSVFTITAAKGLQTPLMVNWDATTPQETQFQAPSAVYRFPPPTLAAAGPALTSAIITQAEQPRETPSSVKSTNIALALAAPALRGSINTTAEQPLAVQSWSLVNTALLPSFVAGVPPLHGHVQTLPQEQSVFNVNYSFVGVPTAANLPSVTVIPDTTQQPAGHKKRRYEVEIDGQVFEVQSVDEAVQLLTQAKALAVKRAPVVAEEVVRRKLADKPPVNKPIRVPVPQLHTANEELVDIVIRARHSIAKIYREQALAAEIRLRLQLAEQDYDEEDLLFLL